MGSTGVHIHAMLRHVLIPRPTQIDRKCLLNTPTGHGFDIFDSELIVLIPTKFESIRQLVFIIVVQQIIDPLVVDLQVGQRNLVGTLLIAADQAEHVSEGSWDNP